MGEVEASAPRLFSVDDADVVAGIACTWCGSPAGEGCTDQKHGVTIPADTHAQRWYDLHNLHHPDDRREVVPDPCRFPSVKPPTRREPGVLVEVNHVRLEAAKAALRLAQQALAGEEDVEWARGAVASSLSLAEAMGILDGLLADDEELADLLDR